VFAAWFIVKYHTSGRVVFTL